MVWPASGCTAHADWRRARPAGHVLSHLDHCRNDANNCKRGKNCWNCKDTDVSDVQCRMLTGHAGSSRQVVCGTPYKRKGKGSQGRERYPKSGFHFLFLTISMVIIKDEMTTGKKTNPIPLCKILANPELSSPSAVPDQAPMPSPVSNIVVDWTVKTTAITTKYVAASVAAAAVNGLFSVGFAIFF